MEGVVAGVPRLAQYDVDIDAGSDASDPESAVSFSLETPSGETLKQPGNLFFLTETALYGTNKDLLADVKQDADGDGKAEFGEGIPDADTYVATLRKFKEMAEQLDADAQEFEATPSDALTAITVMTPTMCEYFEAWKNSALHRRLRRRGARLRRHLAALRHRRHPRGHPLHLRGDRADDRRRGPAAGRADQAAARGADRLRRRSARPREAAVRSSPASRPTRSAPRRRPGPRRSPAR